MVFVGFRYVQIWIFLCSFSRTCLVAKKISIRQKKKNLGHRMGPEVPWPNRARGTRGPCGAGLGPTKKIRLLIGPGSGCGSKPGGRAWVWKNPARTRPIAIPTPNEDYGLVHLKAKKDLLNQLQPSSIGQRLRRPWINYCYTLIYKRTAFFFNELARYERHSKLANWKFSFFDLEHVKNLLLNN